MVACATIASSVITFSQDAGTPPPDYVEYDKEPVNIHQVRPKYPEEAKAQRLEGTVIVKGWVGKDGAVKDVKHLKSDQEIFNEAAIDAVQQWKFETASNKGIPVDVWIAISFKFRLGDAQSYEKDAAERQKKADADALKSADFDHAVQEAAANGKYVLLHVGSDTLKPSIALRELLLSDPKLAPFVSKNFEYVFMNVNLGIINGGIPFSVKKKLGDIKRYSIPSLFVVDGSGRCLSNVDNKLLMEGKEFSSEKILTMLGDWTPEAVKSMEKEK